LVRSASPKRCSDLFPQPLLPRESGSKKKLVLSPSPTGEGFRERWIRKKKGRSEKSKE
jgi:hypothetical protein